MDTGTPAGKMVFTVLGAVAELEPTKQQAVCATVSNTPPKTREQNTAIRRVFVAADVRLGRAAAKRSTRWPMKDEAEA